MIIFYYNIMALFMNLINIFFLNAEQIKLNALLS